ncbi:Hypothetical protein SRAE_0000040200 [Strongyloides ratti]|uniref:Uncharacterized protein n=1 Tax=Strongyloides ratti TaxID=34506 RepID=A0A090KV43_STRRB|nr:Hypothetical protein SRAE_0000040200 [Strongyloides ratti]CEF61276.1 Hypothetical protein SRAE_0000040200 [Strongyloides ratti]
MFSRLPIGRKFLKLSNNTSWKRGIHKGVDSTPPMRFIPITQKVAFYGFIIIAFLSYPSYVLSKMDSLRPRPDNSLAPEVVEEMEQRKASRKK